MTPSLAHQPLCRKCAERHPSWKEARDKATVAVAEEDPIPCFCCRRTAGYLQSHGEDRGTIMDCLIDPARRFPWLPEIAEKPGHWWSGWPGAYCLKCGSEDPMEIAIADNWYDPFTDQWDTPEHKAQVQAANLCPADVPTTFASPTEALLAATQLNVTMTGTLTGDILKVTAVRAADRP